ncbi:CUB and sushi domain-containing protein 3-like protein [Leptotrombidium deliense]|uniref:CUB and sushi domain-containing protein 3-like protein n=1 Tax=Leptotrombidium deliense TaxID=299467 RepID=A0A443SMQ4_9ACAR|nr:CUB and sushi domain-containing protein 3-like protein [Leptotrombidium deliense]
MVGVQASLSLCEVLVFTTKEQRLISFGRAEFSADRCGTQMEHQQLISFNQTCYEFQTQAGGSFSDAQSYCKARGGLVVNSVVDVTHNFLFFELERLKTKLKSRLVWLGARREVGSSQPTNLFHRSRTNVWKWVNGQPVLTFLWADDQPNNYNGQQNCIVLDGGRKWLWNDVTCDLDYLPWICQYTPSNCGSPDKHLNSTILEKDYRVGREITYKCPVGHKIVGNELRLCQSDGFWSGSPPNCVYVNCGPLSDIEHGRVFFVNQSRTTFNATSKYVCDSEYSLVGNESRMCLGNGSWSDKEPKCLYSWCPELPIIPNGFLNVTNRTENGIANYICHTGHKLIGNGTRQCQLGGKWTGEEPICKYIDCGMPLDVRYGRYNLLNRTTTYQSMVKYECDRNYTLIGNETRNCTEYATWANVEPTCKLINCGKPEIPFGSELIGDKFTIGSEITVKCKPGYKMMSGHSKHKCNNDGKWESEMPVCKCNLLTMKFNVLHENIDCGRVLVILKGEVKYANNTTHLGSVLNYTCSTGYKVVGAKLRECGEDGKWSDSSPKCEEIRCVPPEKPKNSSVVYSGNDRSTSDSFKVTSTVQYRCSSGHIVKGESLRTCESDGTWNGNPPSCAYVDCGFPFVISNGRWLLTTNTTHYGSTVEYECSANFKINGPSRRLCLENATWSGTPPVCEVVNCGKPPTRDEKTMVEGSVFAVGERVSYSCHHGYELVGDEQRVCQNNGDWSNDTPYCRIVDCGKPPVLPNGRGYLLNGTTTYESIIEYRCMPEFKITGDPRRRCTATGSWSGSLPRCLELSLIKDSENNIDSRIDGLTGNLQMESSKALGIGIAVGIGALLILVIIITIVCLKTKKPQPVKNTENVEVNRPPDKDTATVMSYSRLSLESEANHHNGGPIRHHPNGLVTFSSPLSHQHNTQPLYANTGGLNVHSTNGYRSPNGNGNIVAIRSNNGNQHSTTTPRFMVASAKNSNKNSMTSTLEV